ncbi:Exopolyphosphatase [Arthrobotrys musiformis]|uniref:Exopolyphosphatase n=1 Tax=Arthrobotrys musiformis TaxID=47236 RepID=A0AAV9VXZ8_9PEZI
MKVRVRKMETFTSLQQFLLGAKHAFNLTAGANKPVHLVVGNESADLDSFASSIIYAYLHTITNSPETPKFQDPNPPDKEISNFFSRLKEPTIPLLSIPRNEVSLRPEHAKLASHLSFSLSDIPTLSDLPANLNPQKTSITLVDHNVLQPPLAPTFSKSISAIIDHHHDENLYTGVSPRTITTSGSCASLITNHFRTHYPTHWQNLPDSIHSEIARLALAPILIDTANLKAQSKVTPVDIVQVTELLERVGEGFDSNKFYEEIQAAKGDITGLSIDGLLRKDYKQWKEKNGVVLGVSAINRSLSWVVQKAGGIEAFAGELETYAKDRGLDIAIVMTTDNSKGFRRDLLIWGANERTRGFAQSFEDSANEKFRLERWPKEEDEVTVNAEIEGMKAWTQASLDLSRKQVAPVLRDIANKL